MREDTKHQAALRRICELLGWNIRGPASCAQKSAPIGPYTNGPFLISQKDTIYYRARHTLWYDYKREVSRHGDKAWFSYKWSDELQAWDPKTMLYADSEAEMLAVALDDELYGGERRRQEQEKREVIKRIEAEITLLQARRDQLLGLNL